MKIYLVWQVDNNGYDTYDSCVVCAENEDDAKTITPDDEIYTEPVGPYTNWALKKESIFCREIGVANENQERGVILASFNAG